MRKFGLKLRIWLHVGMEWLKNPPLTIGREFLNAYEELEEEKET